MGYRGFVLIGAVLGAGALASAAACSGPDPGALTFAERSPQGAGDQQSSGSSSGASGSKSGGGNQEGGAPGGGDAGSAADSVFGTTTFTYQDPGVTANDVPDHGGPVEGKNCADCHKVGGAAASKLWVFAGTVYSTAQGGATVPQAEVRVVGPDGAEVGSAYTDKNGNFWLDKGGTTIPANAKAGVRKGGAPQKMVAPLGPTNSGCNSTAGCHGSATQKLFVN